MTSQMFTDNGQLLALQLFGSQTAFVDAHLKDFDIDEDLSIDIGPKIDNDPFAPMRVGIFVTLK